MVSASVGAAAVPPSAIGLPKITIVGAAEGDADDAAADAVVVAFGTTLTGYVKRGGDKRGIASLDTFITPHVAKTKLFRDLFYSPRVVSKD